MNYIALYCIALHYIHLHTSMHTRIPTHTYIYIYIFLFRCIFIYEHIHCIAWHIHSVRGSFQTSPFQGLLSSGPCWCGLFGDQCYVHRGRGPHVLEGRYFLRGMMRNQVEKNGRLPATGMISLVLSIYDIYIYTYILDIICCYKSISNMNLLGP